MCFESVQEVEDDNDRASKTTNRGRHTALL